MSLETLRIYSIFSALIIGFWVPIQFIGYHTTESLNIFCNVLVSVVSIVNVYLHFKENEISYKTWSEWFSLTVLLDVVCILPLNFFGVQFFQILTCRHIWRIKSLLDQYPTLNAVYYRLIPLAV